MVGVAQLAERQVVVLDVVGSSPIVHPKFPQVRDPNRHIDPALLPPGDRFLGSYPLPTGRCEPGRSPAESGQSPPCRPARRAATRRRACAGCPPTTSRRGWLAPRARATL